MAERSPWCNWRKYGEKPGPLRWQDGHLTGAVLQDGAWLKANAVAPWMQLAERGVGVMVGEWGAFHRTPHDVTFAKAVAQLPLPMIPKRIIESRLNN